MIQQSPSSLRNINLITRITIAQHETTCTGCGGALGIDVFLVPAAGASNELLELESKAKGTELGMNTQT